MICEQSGKNYLKLWWPIRASIMWKPVFKWRPAVEEGYVESDDDVLGILTASSRRNDSTRRSWEDWNWNWVCAVLTHIRNNYFSNESGCLTTAVRVRLKKHTLQSRTLTDRLWNCFSYRNVFIHISRRATASISLDAGTGGQGSARTQMLCSVIEAACYNYLQQKVGSLGKDPTESYWSMFVLGLYLFLLRSAQCLVFVIPRTEHI